MAGPGSQEPEGYPSAQPTDRAKELFQSSAESAATTGHPEEELPPQMPMEEAASGVPKRSEQTRRIPHCRIAQVLLGQIEQR